MKRIEHLSDVDLPYKMGSTYKINWRISLSVEERTKSHDHLRRFRNVFDKRNYLARIKIKQNKNSKKLWNFLNLVKDIYEEDAINIILNSQNWTLYPKIRKSPVMSALSFWFHIVLEVLVRETTEGKKRHVDCKGRSKFSLLADDLILHVATSKASTKNFEIL